MAEDLKLMYARTDQAVLAWDDQLYRCATHGRKRNEHLILEALRLAELRHDFAVAQDIQILRLVLFVRVPEEVNRGHVVRLFQRDLEPVEIGVVGFIPIRVGITVNRRLGSAGLAIRRQAVEVGSGGAEGQVDRSEERRS